MVRCIYKFFPLFLSFFFSPVLLSTTAFPDKSTFLGIEVIGVNHTITSQIKDLTPVKVGNFVSLNDKQYYCNLLINRIKEKNLVKIEPQCSAILFREKNTISSVYLIVEINLQNKSKKLIRTIPSDNRLVKIPKELDNLYKKMEERFLILMKNQDPVSENYKKGFIDYEDPTLHNYALQLSNIAPKYNMILLKVIRYSRDEEERQKAAKLLAWSGHRNENLEIALKWKLFFDPDKGVRNALARSFGVFIGHIEDENLLKKLLPMYCQLIELPSFTDKNKGLVSIVRILRTRPHLSSTIGAECKNNIIEMSEVSILKNVGGVAKDVVKLMNES